MQNMVEGVQGGRGPELPQNGSIDPNAYSKLKGNLLALSDLFTRISSNGSLSDDEHFCHQVAVSVMGSAKISRTLMSSQNEVIHDVASNTFLIMTQTIATELGKTSLEKAAKEYEEGRTELMHQVLSTFALHPSATETLGRELHLIAHTK